MAALVLSISCSGGGGSGGEVLSNKTTGFDVPTEISAVSTSSGSNNKPTVENGLSNMKPGFGSKFKAVQKAATDPGTDYSNAKTKKFVEARTLEQFEIIEEVLNALGQTHYADSANINQGPYKAMVAWEEESNGIDVKQLQPWVVDSKMIVENGQDVNRVRVWIEEAGPGGMELIKGEFKIYTSATKNSDGSYKDFGVWTMNVTFGDSLTDFFVASASVENGVSVIKLQDVFPEGNISFSHKGILYRTDTSGYGKVEFPDWEAVDWGNCDNKCTPSTTDAIYAYNAGFLGVQKGTSSIQFFDRNSTTEMTHRYGLFDSVTGQDVHKTKTFGFPIQFTLNDVPMFGYYGAWQGRHEIWSGTDSIPPGTKVTRQDIGTGQTAKTYTVSAPFKGTLVKRSTVPGTLSDIQGIPVETWINEFYNLVYDATNSKWENCVNPDFSTNPMTCTGGLEDFTNFLPSLEVSANDNRKFVNINRFDGQQDKNYVYVSSNPSGFYEATFDQQTGKFISNGNLFVPSDKAQLWASVGGSIYIEYDGIKWVEKEVVSFDTRTWTPEFSTNDKSYTLPLDQELYINSKGTNYIVKRTSSTTEVELEIQTVANPKNASDLVLSGTVFKFPWNTNDSTFTFDTDDDPNSGTFLKLKYASVGEADKDNKGGDLVKVGDVVTRGIWGLEAYDSNGDPTGIQFNWDYPRDGETWGTSQYLIDSQNKYVLVSDPIRLVKVDLKNGKGVIKKLLLQYDGWMHGLPNMYEELRKNDFVMSQTISDKIINIPAGTKVTDWDNSNQSYLIKPLETSVFLTVDTNPSDPPDLTQANALDLLTIPSLVDPGMGAMPSTTGVKYSEGKLLE